MADDRELPVVAWAKEDGSDAMTLGRHETARLHAGLPGLRIAEQYGVPLVRQSGALAAISKLTQELQDARDDAESWQQQARSRIDDALRIAAERDVLAQEVRARIENEASACNYAAQFKAERDAARQEAQALREALKQSPCGHPRSAMRVAAETGADLYCEHCDDKSARRDAERCELELSMELAALKKAQAEPTSGASDQ